MAELTIYEKISKLNNRFTPSFCVNCLNDCDKEKSRLGLCVPCQKKN